MIIVDWWNWWKEVEWEEGWMSAEPSIIEIELCHQVGIFLLKIFPLEICFIMFFWLSCFSTASLVMSRGRGIEKVIHYMPYINQALLIIQYFIHYTKGDAVTEELYIALYIITDCTRRNKMRWEWGDARDPSLKSHSEVFARGHRGGVSNLQFPRIFKSSSHQQHLHIISEIFEEVWVLDGMSCIHI